MNSLKVVYIEDDVLSREIMLMMLENVLGVEQYAMLADTHALQTRLMALAFTPDIILLDIHIQPVDGYAAIGLLRQLPSLHACKIVALTASVMSKDLERLRQLGFDGMITKPIDMDIFPDLIARVMAGDSVWNIS